MIKKIVGVMLAMAFMLSIVHPVSAATAKKATSSDISNDISFYISIYNQETRSYAVENTKLTVSRRMTIIDSVELLKEQESIEGYTVKNNVLMSVNLKESVIETTDESFGIKGFYMKRNGQTQPAEGVNRLIENGDIIEWIYGDLGLQSVVSAPTEEVASEVKGQTALWTDTIQEALADGCEFLTLNQETSTMYIIALGCSGKTADVKMVNELLSNIRQTAVYESPLIISRNILSLTFCGYDAAELVSQLSLYEGIDKNGIGGAIYGLIAYDSKQYAVPIDKINSRDSLISSILAKQGKTGGFKHNAYAQEDVETTALAITALSPYTERSEVKAAIDSGVEYLVKNQTSTGGFGISGEESSKSLSSVIVALSSVGIEIDDDRFVKDSKNLLDGLMEYRKNDGGFSELHGSPSNTSATEQAVIALCAIKQSDNPYKMKRSLSPPPQTKTEEKNLVVAITQPPRLITIILVTLSIAIVCLVLFISVMAKRKSKK